MNRAAQATIDTAALRANLGVVRSFAPGSRIMAVIKANAYGHGIVPVARALAGADAFAVARLEEAHAIRQAGLETPIVLLEGIFHTDQMALAASLRLEIVVHSPEQLEMLEQFDNAYRFPVWLKIDTGMNRLGFPDTVVDDVARRLSGCDSVETPIRFMTHLSSAEERFESTTPEQIKRFDSVLAGIDAERSIANSAGVIAWPGSHADWVRPGLMLYGVSPLRDKTAADLDLKPAMTLTTELIAIKTVSAGGRVGYGGRWMATEETRLGVAAIGYGDGYTRHLGDGTPVMVAGQPAILVGCISMDLITIDLGGAPDARVGDEVLLWGEQLPVERLAEAAGTIPYEMLCGVTQRVAMTVI
ncbi:MAG: alanine racemase [Gammaproteobacteria bacterium]